MKKIAIMCVASMCSFIFADDISVLIKTFQDINTVRLGEPDLPATLLAYNPNVPVITWQMPKNCWYAAALNMLCTLEPIKSILLSDDYRLPMPAREQEAYKKLIAIAADSTSRS